MRITFGPRDWDLGFETEIWALRLRFEGGTEVEEKEEKEKNSPYV